MVNSERNYSLNKEKIKFLLLEGIHPRAGQLLESAGYTNIVEERGALTPNALAKALNKAGAADKSRLKARLLAGANLLGILQDDPESWFQSAAPASRRKSPCCMRTSPRA